MGGEEEGVTHSPRLNHELGVWNRESPDDRDGKDDGNNDCNDDDDDVRNSVEEGGSHLELLITKNCAA